MSASVRTPSRALSASLSSASAVRHVHDADNLVQMLLRTALELLGRTYIDVLVSDIGMPGADGYDLISRVRELEREHGGRIPAVALTAYAGEDNRDRALSAGFTSHVTKPVSPARLVRIVAQAIGRPALL